MRMFERKAKGKHLQTKNVRLGEPPSRLHMLEKLSYGKEKEQIFVKNAFFTPSVFQIII